MTILRLISGISAISSGILLILTIILSANLATWFDWTIHPLSALGSEGSDTAPIFNSGLILSGIFVAVFSLGLFRNLNHKIGLVGSIILIISSIFLAAAGYYYLPLELHSVGATGFFISLPISLILIGVGFLFDKKKKLGAYSILSSLTIASFVFLLPMNFLVPPAIAEFSVLIIFVIWIFIQGIKLIKLERTTDNSRGSNLK